MSHLSLLKRNIPNSEHYCFQARDGVELTVLQSYCWMYSTTKIPTQYKGACSGIMESISFSHYPIDVQYK